MYKLFLTVFLAYFMTPSNIYAAEPFETFIDKVYANDILLNNLQQKYEQTENQPLDLESMLSRGTPKDTNESLQEIKLREDKLLLQVLYQQINATLQKRSAGELFSLSTQMFDLFEKKVRPTLKDLGVTQSSDIENALTDINKLMKEQNHKLDSSLYQLQSLSALPYEALHVDQKLHHTLLPVSAKETLENFNALPSSQQNRIQNILNILDIEEFINSAYKSHLNLLVKLGEVTKETLSLQKKSSNDLASQFQNRVNLAKKQMKIADIHLKIAQEKSLILYVNGTLREALFSYDDSHTMPVFKATKVQEPMRLRRIHFSGNSTEISSYSMPIVISHAHKLKQMRDYILELHAHSDTSGDKKTNFKLSEIRAEVVKNKLIELGIDADLIQTFAHGDTQPLFTNETKRGRLLNRRVEFIIKKKED